MLADPRGFGEMMAKAAMGLWRTRWIGGDAPVDGWNFTVRVSFGWTKTISSINPISRGGIAQNKPSKPDPVTRRYFSSGVLAAFPLELHAPDLNRERLL